MPENWQDIGTYANVTGVIDGAAAAEITTILTTLKGLIPDPDTAPANRGDNAYGVLDQVSPYMAGQYRHEIDNISGAIAAAPVS